MSSIILCNKSFRRGGSSSSVQQDGVVVVKRSRDDERSQRMSDPDDLLDMYNNVKLEDRLPSSQQRGHALYSYIPQMIIVDDESVSSCWSSSPLDRGSGDNCSGEEITIRPRTKKQRNEKRVMEHLNQITDLLDDLDNYQYDNAAGVASFSEGDDRIATISCCTQQSSGYQTVHLDEQDEENTEDERQQEGRYSQEENDVEKKETVGTTATKINKLSLTFQEDDTWLEFCDDLPLPR